MESLDGKTRARFWMKVRVAPADACWEWLAGRMSFGYGRFRLGQATRSAHRISYLLSRGAVPEGYQLDHLCRHPWCVNPSHLQPVTARENTLRSTSISALNAVKTHCKNGHPFTEPNTYRHRGVRYCRACNRAAARRANARRSAVAK